MRALAVAMLLALSACSMIQDEYDDQARTECHRSAPPADRYHCEDRIDQQRRERGY